MGRPDAFLDRLVSGRPLVMDGPTGTELARRGVDTTTTLWSARAILDAPEVLTAIHAEHHAAGAELHTAATFRTNPRTLARAGLEGEAGTLVEAAVRIARHATRSARPDGTASAWIAGSMAPVEDCYTPALAPGREELQREHRAHARLLADAGVDLLLVETMNTVREAEAAAAAARETGLPVLVSLVVGADGALLSGEPLHAAVHALAPWQPDALLLNCAGVTAMDRGVTALRSAWAGPWGAYPNASSGDAQSGWSDEVPLPVFTAFASRWLAAGARLVGGCCGTRPTHVRALAGLVDALQATA